VSVELTYGLERLTMYLQGVDNVYDLMWAPGVRYGDVHHRQEVEGSTYNFKESDPEMLFALFAAYEKELPQTPREGARPARLRVLPEVLARLQPAGRARRDQRHRAHRLHQAGAPAGAALGRSPSETARGAGFPLLRDVEARAPFMVTK